MILRVVERARIDNTLEHFLLSPEQSKGGECVNKRGREGGREGRWDGEAHLKFSI